MVRFWKAEAKVGALRLKCDHLILILWSELNHLYSQPAGYVIMTVIRK